MKNANKFVFKTYVSLALLFFAVIAGNALLTMLIEWKAPNLLINRETGGIKDIQKAVTKMTELSANCAGKTLILGSSISKEFSIGNSVNLSYLGPAAKVQKIFIEKLMKELDVCPEKNVRVLFEILPLLYTRKSVRSFADKNSLKAAFLLSFRDLMNIMWHDPSTAYEYAVIKLRRYYPSEVNAKILHNILFPQDKISATKMTHIFDEHYDLTSGDFDLEEIDNLHRLLSPLSQMDLYLYIPPQNISAWQYSETGRNRVESFISKLEQFSKHPVIRGDRETFSSSEFRDPIHLSASGVEKFQQMLQKNL